MQIDGGLIATTKSLTTNLRLIIYLARTTVEFLYFGLLMVLERLLGH